jgi:hypothetical protein
MELTNFNNKVIEYLKQRNTLVSSSELCTVMKTYFSESELPPRGKFITHVEKIPNIIKNDTLKKDMPYFGFNSVRKSEGIAEPSEDTKLVNNYVRDFKTYLYFNRIFKTDHTDDAWEKLKNAHDVVTTNYNMFVSKFPRLLYKVHNLKLKRLPNKPSEAIPFVPLDSLQQSCELGKPEPVIVKPEPVIVKPKAISYAPIVDYNEAINLINNAKKPETFLAANPPGLFLPPKAAHLTRLDIFNSSNLSLPLPPLPPLPPGPAPMSAYRQSAFTQPFKPITSYPTISEIYKSNLLPEESLIQQSESLLGLEMPKSENLINLLEKISSIDTPLVHHYRQQLKHFDISRLENLIREIQIIKNQSGDYRIPSYF